MSTGTSKADEDVGEDDLFNLNLDDEDDPQAQDEGDDAWLDDLDNLPSAREKEEEMRSALSGMTNLPMHMLFCQGGRPASRPINRPSSPPPPPPAQQLSPCLDLNDFGSWSGSSSSSSDEELDFDECARHWHNHWRKRKTSDPNAKGFRLPNRTIYLPVQRSIDLSPVLERNESENEPEEETSDNAFVARYYGNNNNDDNDGDSDDDMELLTRF